MIQITARHWVLASAVALLLHAGLAAALLWLPPERGAVRSGVGGIEVALGPAGGAPGSASTDDRDLPEAEPAGVPEETSAVIPDEEAEILPDPVPVDTETADDVVETVEAEPVPVMDFSESADVPVEPEEVAAVQPVDVVETAPSELPVEARPVVIPPRPSRKPAPLQSAPPQPAPAVPVAQARTAERTIEQATRPVGLPTETRTDVAMPAGSEGKSGTKETRDAGSGSGGSAGGSPAAVTDYMAELLAWLQRHKEYPRRAKRRQQQGTALLYLVMDREGQVLEYRIQESSGHRLLDQEVTAMIERARPLPGMPDEMPGAQLELVVPVEFFLR